MLIWSTAFSPEVSYCSCWNLLTFLRGYIVMGLNHWLWNETTLRPNPIPSLIRCSFSLQFSFLLLFLSHKIVMIIWWNCMLPSASLTASVPAFLVKWDTAATKKLTSEECGQNQVLASWTYPTVNLLKGLITHSREWPSLNLFSILFTFKNFFDEKYPRASGLYSDCPGRQACFPCAARGITGRLISHKLCLMS